jgi:hypothetical protein
VAKGMTMEILDLKFAGIPVSMWLFIAAGFFFCKNLYKAWEDGKERRRWRKDYETKKKKFEK